MLTLWLAIISAVISLVAQPHVLSSAVPAQAINEKVQSSEVDSIKDAPLYHIRGARSAENDFDHESSLKKRHTNNTAEDEHSRNDEDDFAERGIFGAAIRSIVRFFKFIARKIAGLFGHRHVNVEVHVNKTQIKG